MPHTAAVRFGSHQEPPDSRLPGRPQDELRVILQALQETAYGDDAR